MSEEIRIDSGLVKNLITKRHKGPQGEWAVFSELRDGTGFQSNGQQIDVFAMHTWPSKGFNRIAYEVKVSRADFIREMQDPSKRTWAMDISHQFYFVAPAEVIKVGELPLECGFLAVTKNGDKLRTVKVAPHRTPRGLKMLEIAAILRAAENHRKYPHWRFAGQDLTEDQLFELINARRGHAERMAIEKKAMEMTKHSKDRLMRLVKGWADEFKRAGFEPPGWMADGNIHAFPQRWEIEEWIKKNVSPAGSTINDALLRASAAQKNISGVIDSIESLKASEAKATQ